MGEEEANPAEQGLRKVAQPSHLYSSHLKMIDTENDVSRQAGFLFSLEEMIISASLHLLGGPWFYHLILSRALITFPTKYFFPYN